jgi:predicted neuraminidase
MASSLKLALLVALAVAAAQAETPEYHAEPIFLPEAKHNHASCIVGLNDGSLLATWYSGSGERRSDDVEVQGAWKVPGRERWGPRFQMADTPGYPDCNPALFRSVQGVWLFWPTILDHRWEGALLKFKQADNVEPMRPISWSRSGVIHVTPDSKTFEAVIRQSVASLSQTERRKYAEELALFEDRSKDLLYQRLGWMPRIHPIQIPENLQEKHPGRWILPLYSDTFSTSIMAYSDDQGGTWKTGRPMIGFGNIQPSLVREKEGTLVAFMRDNGPHRRIRRSTSDDDGETWTPAQDTALPNPGAGIEVIRLVSGKWALVYNDTTKGRHSLAISLSVDEGQTWPCTRHLEQHEPGGGSFHYPSIDQPWVRDARGNLSHPIHVTYTHNVPGRGSTIKHAMFNEAWIMAGDPPQR